MVQLSTPGVTANPVRRFLSNYFDLLLYNGNVVPVVFFCILQLLIVIFHGSPSVIKLIRLLPAVDQGYFYGQYATIMCS